MSPSPKDGSLADKLVRREGASNAREDRTMKHGDAVVYRCFTRTWWRINPAWPDGREPGAGAKRTVAVMMTEEGAREFCEQWNKTHKPGKLSRKCEYERM